MHGHAFVKYREMQIIYDIVCLTGRNTMIVIDLVSECSKLILIYVFRLLRIFSSRVYFYSSFFNNVNFTFINLV